MRRFVLAFLLISSLPVPLRAAERRDIGLTQKGARIQAFFVEGESAASPLVILVGGLNGVGGSSRAVEREIQRYEGIAKNRRTFRLIAIPSPNPERSPLQFPPGGAAYRENAESHVLWRWIGSHAPDLVVVAGEDFGLAQALSQKVREVLDSE